MAEIKQAIIDIGVITTTVEQKFAANTAITGIAPEFDENPFTVYAESADNVLRFKQHDDADVDEADVGWIEVGQEAQVTLDSFPGRSLTGQVVAVLPSATLDLGIVSYRVTIGIDRGDLSLRDGMTANI